MSYERFRWRRAAAVVGFLALGLGGIPLTAGAIELQFGGTGNALGTVAVLARAFEATAPGVKITVLPSVGTSGAIKAVPKGALHLGLSSRPLTEEERQTGIVDLEYARSPTVFAVAKTSPVRAITVAEVEAIYAGTLKTWPDGTTIRPILRQANDDNTRQIIALSSGLAAAVAAAEKRSGMSFATTDQEAADRLEILPGGLGVTTLALILSEKRSLRALSLDGVEPNLETLRSGAYPLVKRFFFILPTNASPEVLAFVRYVQSDAGHAILRGLGQTPP